MVAGDMVKRALTTSSAKGPKCSMYFSSQTGRRALSLLEQGRLAVSQICFKGRIIAS
jgi:hypothetical protein